MDPIATIICTDLDIYNKQNKAAAPHDGEASPEVPSGGGTAESELTNKTTEFKRIVFGSRAQSTTLLALESSNVMFGKIRRKFNKYLSNHLEGTRVTLHANHEVFIDILIFEYLWLTHYN